MTHVTKIIDNDTRFVVDPVTRVVTGYDLVVVNPDHRSEKVTFEVPRYIEGHDMLESKVEVHYSNVNRKTKEQSNDIDDECVMMVDPADEEKVIFTWAIPNTGTVHVGYLYFSLHFVCSTDGVIEYSFGTIKNKQIKVAESVHNTEQIVAEYSNILQTLTDRVEQLATPTRIEVDDEGNVSIMSTRLDVISDDEGNVTLEEV